MKQGNQRTKGHSFERRIARDYRKVFDPPDRVRRGRQTHRADEPDVVVNHAPLWTECGHGAVMNPLAKLKQAEKEARIAGRIGVTGRAEHLVVAVTRRNRAAIRATMRLETLMRLQLLNPSPPARVQLMPVHVEWSDFLELLRAQPWVKGGVV